MKQGIRIILALLMLLLAPLPAALAADGDPTFSFTLLVDGQEELAVDPGDEFTLTLTLRREGGNEPYPMHAMQAELRYDGSFLQLVEGSGSALNGVLTQDVPMDAPFREYYMNFLSLSGGSLWQPETVVGTVRFRVTGASGVTRISNEDFSVSLPDGSGSYPCRGNEVLLILSTDCLVHFETNGGTPLEDVRAIYGEKLTRPEDPVRPGYHLSGWYRDIRQTEPWDFDRDTVEGNMTLYARWEEGDPPRDLKAWLLWVGLLLLLVLVLLLGCVLRRRKPRRHLRR